MAFMKKTNTNSRNQLYVLLFIVVAIVAVAYYFSKDSEQELSKNSAYTTAKVINIEERFQKGFFIKYEYSIRGKRYTSYRPLPDEIQNAQIGDVHKLRYAIDKPVYNEIIFDNSSE